MPYNVNVWTYLYTSYYYSIIIILRPFHSDLGTLTVCLQITAMYLLDSYHCNIFWSRHQLLLYNFSSRFMTCLLYLRSMPRSNTYRTSLYLLAFQKKDTHGTMQLHLSQYMLSFNNALTKNNIEMDYGALMLYTHLLHLYHRNWKVNHSTNI